MKHPQEFFIHTFFQGWGFNVSFLLLKLQLSILIVSMIKFWVWAGQKIKHSVLCQLLANEVEAAWSTGLLPAASDALLSPLHQSTPSCLSPSQSPLSVVCFLYLT